MAAVVFFLCAILLKPVFPEGLAAGVQFLLVFNAMAAVGLLAGHVAVVLLFERMDWQWTGFGPEAWHPRDLLAAPLLGALVILVPATILLLMGHLTFGAGSAGGFWGAAGVAAVVLSIPALVEELLLRGYAFGSMEREFGTATAIVATSVIFGALHLGNPGATLWSIAGVTVAGVFLGAVRSVTGSVVAAFLAHLAINWVQGAILHLPISRLELLPTPGYRGALEGPVWLTGGAWGIEGGAVTAGTLVVVSFLVFLARTIQRPRGRSRELHRHE